MTWLPFSAGPLIIFRASTDLDGLAWWEVVGAFAMLMLSTWLAMRLGARLFRIGLLSVVAAEACRNPAPGAVRADERLRARCAARSRERESEWGGAPRALRNV